MPNYNYRSCDYARRPQCQRSINAMPVKAERECTTFTDDHASIHCVHEPLNGLAIAMAYVPWQEWKKLYPVEKALCRGTIFEELDKPFMGIGGCCK